MGTNKIKELEATRAKLAVLEQEVATEQAKELAALPSRYGFKDAASFIKALKAASGGNKGGKAKTGKRRKRAVIDDKVKATVKKLHDAGKTGAAIAEAAGISVPSVQNIKKELGLTRARKK